MQASSMAGSTRQAEVLIFGYGNPSRGDDALGPLLLERLEPLLTPTMHAAAGGIELLTDFQLQVEHAFDLKGRRFVLFADAHVACPSPWQLTAVQPARDVSYSTHAISPASVLGVYQQVLNETPPPCFLLAIRGERFELGEPLTPQAEANLNAAVERVLTFIADQM